MRKTILVILLLVTCVAGYGQVDTSAIEMGTVSYRNSQNVYVKFTSTEHIREGDTLYVTDGSMLQPVLIVRHKSSISCVAESIGEAVLNVGDTVIHKQASEALSVPINPIGQEPEVPVQEETPSQEVGAQPLSDESPARPEQSIKGRLSLSYYSTMSDREGYDRHRMRYTFSLNGQNLGDSRFSAESYISYRHTLNDPVSTGSALDALKVYKLALGFQASDRVKLWLGRRYNSNISNIGAIDGIQFETTFKHLVLGGFAGTRPDHSDYSFNPDLLQYGAFLRSDFKLKHGFMYNTLSLVEQRNTGAIDRRFAYFQHTSTPAKKLHLFTSFEMELYQMENGNPTSKLNLSSVYFSLRYRASRKLSLFTSYDARKNVIYYETYKNFIDQLIEEETRQGFRARINYRPIKNITLGVSGGYRFQKDNPNESKNFRAYLTHSRIPGLKLSATASAIVLKTVYLDGIVYGLRLSRDIIKGKLSGQGEFRRVRYTYFNSDYTLQQNIAGGSLSWRLNKKLSLNIYYEGIFGSDTRRSNMHLRAIRRI